jgi:hypothetical protein
MADNLIYEMSSSVELDGEPFLRKDNIYVIDQNNGSYTNNQIILDLASISNSGKWCDFANAKLVVPLLITMTSEFDFHDTATDYVAGG